MTRYSAQRLLALGSLPLALLLASPRVSAATPATPSPESQQPVALPNEGLGLEEAIRLALSRSHLVRIQSFGVPIARAGVTTAWGRFDPRLTASYNEAKNDTPLTPFSSAGALRPFSSVDTDSSAAGIEGSSPWGMSYRLGINADKVRATNASTADGTSAFAGLSITQPLLRDFGFSSGLADMRIARTNLRISEWEFQESLVGIVNQVIYAYADVLFNQARLRSAHRALAMARQLKSENERRRAVGSMSEYDVLSAETRVSNREEAVIAAEGDLHSAENNLRALLSREKGPALLDSALNVIPVAPWAPSPGSAAEELRFALENRPDFHRAQLNLKLGGIEASRALNQALPRVDLVASHGYNGLGTNVSTARSDLRTRDYRASSAGLSVSIPLGFAAERGRYRAAKLRQAQAAASLEKLEQDIMIQIGNASVQLDSARRRVETTRRTRELNEQALVAEQKLLKAGTGSTFSVLYQQEQLGYAEISEALAQADFTRASAEYERATGRTLASHRISPTDSLRTN